MFLNPRLSVETRRLETSARRLTTDNVDSRSEVALGLCGTVCAALAIWTIAVPFFDIVVISFLKRIPEGPPHKLIPVTLAEFKQRMNDAGYDTASAFDEFDKDNDNFLTEEEFINGCKKLEPPLDEDQAVDVFGKIDGGADGQDRDFLLTKDEMLQALGKAEITTTPASTTTSEELGEIILHFDGTTDDEDAFRLTLVDTLLDMGAAKEDLDQVEISFSQSKDEPQSEDEGEGDAADPKPVPADEEPHTLAEAGTLPMPKPVAKSDSESGANSDDDNSEDAISSRRLRGGAQFHTRSRRLGGGMDITLRGPKPVIDRLGNLPLDTLSVNGLQAHVVSLGEGILYTTTETTTTQTTTMTTRPPSRKPPKITLQRYKERRNSNYLAVVVVKIPDVSFKVAETSRKWVQRRKHYGCSNWHENLLDRSIEPNSDACGEKCLSKGTECIGFGYQHHENGHCTGGGLKKGACYLWKSTCLDMDNECWTDFKMQTQARVEQMKQEIETVIVRDLAQIARVDIEDVKDFEHKQPGKVTLVHSEGKHGKSFVLAKALVYGPDPTSSEALLAKALIPSEAVTDAIDSIIASINSFSTRKRLAADLSMVDGRSGPLELVQARKDDACSFQAMDGNGDGKMDKEEFMEAVKCFRPPLTKEEAEYAFSELLDANGDNQLNFLEFLGEQPRR